jgi:lipoprotein
MKKTIQTILLGFQLISFSCSVSDPLDSESVSINTDQAITLKTVQVSNLKDQGIYQVSGIIKQGDQLIIGDRIGLRHAVNIDLRSQAQKNLFPRGRSHNAAVAVTSLSTNSDSEITAFDFRQGKLLITPTANTPPTPFHCFLFHTTPNRATAYISYKSRSICYCNRNI